MKHLESYRLFESSEKLAKYQGNCINSFDEDGYCIIPNLYSDTSDFAYNEENADVIDKREFEKHVIIPSDLNKQIGADRTYLYDAKNNIYMLYDENSDIHYFFK